MFIHVCKYQVVAQDVQSGRSSSSNVTIKLKDKNDHQPIFPDDVITADVLETAPENTPVVTVKVRSHYRPVITVKVCSHLVLCCRVMAKHSNLNFGQNRDNNSMHYYYISAIIRRNMVILCLPVSEI